MDYLVILVYIILPVVLLKGSTLTRDSWNDEFMSLSQTKMIQGFMAILIMLHHVSQKICASWIDPQYMVQGLDPFVDVGYLFVGVFFFCSGYGLYLSYKTKPDYLNGFLRKRILPILTMYYLVNMIFLVVRLIMGEKIKGTLWVAYITTLKMPNKNAWYAVTAIIFYVAFYFVFGRIKDTAKAIRVICVIVGIYVLIGSLMDHNEWWLQGEWWYNTAPCFCLGIIFADKKDAIISKIKDDYKKYLLKILLGSLLGHLLFYIANNTLSYYGETFDAPDKVFRRWGCLLVQVPSAMFFVALVMMISLKLKLNNKALKFMGTITLEFYLIHALFVELWGYSFLEIGPGVFYIRNAFFYVAAITICSIISSIILKKINTLILRVITYTKCNEKKVTHHE